MAETTATIDVLLNEGRTIPALGFCPQSPTEALRYYRDRLGAALAGAQDAFAAARQRLEETQAAYLPISESVDKLLAVNPDPTTPSSLEELTDAVGGVQPGATREELEQRVAAVLGINVVNGVVYPAGATDLNALRAMAQALGISADNCDLSLLDSNEGFVLVVSQTETVERVVGSTCGDDIVEFDVIESPIGTNIPIDQAAEAAGVDSATVRLQLFWLDTVKSDPATLRRLKALGLTAQELGGAITGQDLGRLTVLTVETGTLSTLGRRLTDEEICTLLSRPDTGGVTLDPTDDQLLDAISTALNQNAGANRNTAGDDETDGHGDNAALLLAPLVDWLRIFSIEVPPPNVSANLQVAITTEGVELEEDETVAQTQEPRTEAGVTECETILQMVTDSIRALDLLLQDARDFFGDLYRSVGLGSNQINTGLGLATCLGSFNLGLNFALDITLQLPFLFETFLAQFAALLSAVVAAMIAFRLVVCQPQAIIQLLYGGVCGFKPFNFSGCPPSLSELVNRLQNILNVVLSLVGKLTAATRTIKVDFAFSASAAANLKSFNPCVLAATAIALALGLDHQEPAVQAALTGQTTLG